MAKRIQQSVTQNTAEATALYFESVIAPLVQSLADQDDLPPDKRLELGRLITETPLGRRVTSFKIWRDGGTVIYATDPSLIGKRFTPTHELQEAWSGKVAAEFDSLDEEENQAERAQGMALLEIYAPIRDQNSNRIIAVAEFYERADHLQRDIISAQRQSWVIIGLIALCAVGALFGLVGRAGRTIERQIEELRALLAQNEELRHRVERSSQRVSEVNERYLRRLGGDLHDGPAQLMGLALLRLDAVADATSANRAGNRAKRQQDLETVRTSLQEALSEIRNISGGLALPELERLSLRDTIHSAVRDHTRRTDTAVAADIASVEGDAAHAVKTAVFRFVQEALNNATRHAGGAGQSVDARQANGVLTIEVRDQGVGFDPQSPRREGKLGLAGMRERLESIGGEFAIHSAAGQGTCLVARLPYDPGS
jgi:signal transduction histidine kinase